MASSITTVNGMVVVTQVFAQDEEKKLSVPLPTETPQVVVVRSSVVAEKVSEMTKVFLRGQPQALGIVQIFVGLVCMAFSLMALLSPTQLIQAPFLGATAFVVSGSLAVAARKGTSPCLIKATLVLSIISVLVALAGVGYTSLILAIKTNEDFCESTDMLVDIYIPDMPSRRRPGRDRCFEMMRELNKVLGGIRVVTLVLCVLEVCVSITVCVFCGLALGRSRVQKHSRPMAVSGGGRAPSEANSDVALLDGSDDDEAVTTPPPYSP